MPNLPCGTTEALLHKLSGTGSEAGKGEQPALFLSLYTVVPSHPFCYSEHWTGIRYGSTLSVCAITFIAESLKALMLYKAMLTSPMEGGPDSAKQHKKDPHAG